MPDRAVLKLSAVGIKLEAYSEAHEMGHEKLATIEQNGLSDGHENIPPANARAPSAYERSIINSWQELLHAFEERMKLALNKIKATFDNHLAKCQTPDVDEQINDIKIKVARLVIINEPDLEILKQNHTEAKGDFLLFKKWYGLKRLPNYPDSKLFHIGILALLVLVEGAINAKLFAANDELGLLGGWLQAFVISFANILIATLFGYVILRNLQAQNRLTAIISMAAIVPALIFIFTFNLMAAHYRDFYATIPTPATKHYEATPPLVSGHAVSDNTNTHSADQAASGAQSKRRGSGNTAPQPRPQPQATPVAPPVNTQSLTPGQSEKFYYAEAEHKALQRFASNPFDVQTFQGYILFCLGLCFAAIAIYEGYTLDDSHPGYGNVHRRLMRARQSFLEKRKAILKNANDIWTSDYNRLSRTIHAFGESISVIRVLRDAFQEWKRFTREQAPLYQQRMNEALQRYREVNHSVRSEADPKHFSEFPRLHSTSELPDLDNTQLERLAELEKDFAKLQKTIGTLSADMMSAFEKATTGYGELFQRVSETVNKSLLDDKQLEQTVDAELRDGKEHGKAKI